MSCPTCGSKEFELLEDAADRIVDEVIADFKSRGGFDDMFAQIHEETFMELNCDLFDLVMVELVRLRMLLKG